MSLQALPPDTIRLIKSTQVITSLSSMVKELIENSLDAQASIIAIKLENFGFSRLEIRDNGSGIKPADIDFVAKPHYTSKITKFTDLECLESYGFRGEALSSLCSIADVSITTKTADSSVGHVYTFSHKGEVLTRKAAAANKGTTIIVTNLFKLIPVRRQYFSNNKRRKDEFKNLEDLLYGLSLAAPHMHLTLHHDKSIVIQKNPGTDLRGALLNLFPAIARKLVRKNQKVPEVEVELYLPEAKCNDPMAVSRSLPDRLFIIVNKRNINYKTLEKLVKAYYSQSSDSCHGRYPVGIVSLTVPSDAVDVNLEPNKTKVLLKDEGEILKIIEDLLTDIYGALPKGNQKKGKDDESEITCTLACVTQKNSKDKTSKKAEPVQGNTENTLEDGDVDFENFDSSVKIKEVNQDKRNFNFKSKENNEENRNVKENFKIVFEEQPQRKDNISQRVTQKMTVSRSSEISPMKSSDVFTVVGKSSQAAKIVPNPENLVEANFTILGNTPGKNGQENVSILNKKSFKTSTQENAKLETPSRHFSSSCSTIEENDNINSIMNNIEDDFDFDKEVMNKENFNNSLFENLNTDDANNKSKIPEADISLNVTDKVHVSLLGSDGVPVFVFKPRNEDDIENANRLGPLNENSNSHHSTIDIPKDPVFVFKPQNKDDIENANRLGPLNENSNSHHSTIDIPKDPVFVFKPRNKDDIENANRLGPLNENSNSHHSTIDIPKDAFDHDPNGNKELKDICKDLLDRDKREIQPKNAVNATSSKSGHYLETNLLEKDINETEKLSNETNHEIMKTSEMDINNAELNDGGLTIPNNVQPLVSGSWSRGQLDGTTGNIQTVQLAKLPTENFNSKMSTVNREDIQKDGNEISKDKYFTPKIKRLRAPSPEFDISTNKKSKLKSMSPANYDKVYGRPVKRAQSAFIIFTRETRSKVLSEKPGADFAVIAQELANRWKALDSATKKNYQDRASEDQIRYQEEVRKIKEGRGLDTSLDTSLNKSNVSRGGLDKFLAPITPQLVQEKGRSIRVQSIPQARPWREKCKDIQFKLDCIKRKFNYDNSSMKSGDYTLIGSVGEKGWLCMRGSDIIAINTSRIHEVVLSQNLLSSFSLPAPTLTEAIPFNRSELGEDNWSLLMRLPRVEQPDRHIFNVTDKRIIANGFKITLYPCNKNPSIVTHGEIVGLSNCVGYYGLNDLKEILKSINGQQDINLLNSRPIKLKQWIKGEAIRMCRSAANLRSKQEVHEKLEQWKTNWNEMSGLFTRITEPQCIHNKPIFTKIFSLADIPLSQSSQTYLESQMEFQE